MISVSPSGNSALKIRKDDCVLEINELRIAQITNSRTPHCLMNSDGSCLYLTDQELVVVLSEYMRYNLSSAIDFDNHSVLFKMTLIKKAN